MVYLAQLLPTYLLHLTYGLSLGFPSILSPQLRAHNSSSDLALDDRAEGLVVRRDTIGQRIGDEG